MSDRSCCLLLLFALVTPATASGESFASGWPPEAVRTWVGPEYFANRLQDWRIAGGRVECIEAEPNLPLRTLHLLTHTLGSIDGSFEVRVLTGPVDAVRSSSTDTWVGFLIGGGG